MRGRSVAIQRWVEVTDRDALIEEIDKIFFEASATKSFESAAHRAAFRERWLHRYLSGFPEDAFLALAPGGSVAGYLVGSLDDPALSPAFADIGYYPCFATLTARFPAQLHVNLAPQWREQGVGARLVAAFTGHARSQGAPGVHVVTARGMRNARFYLRNGFDEAGALSWNDRELLFLARSLRD